MLVTTQLFANYLGNFFATGCNGSHCIDKVDHWILSSVSCIRDKTQNKHNILATSANCCVACIAS